uniref:Oxysterol-binding protein n=2 Tax=Sus scrofa TaxID=9823 RepID=A0A8D0U0V0_PIG
PSGGYPPVGGKGGFVSTSSSPGAVAGKSGGSPASWIRSLDGDPGVRSCSSLLGEKTDALSFSLHRYFVLDFEAGILQYFVNEQSKHQKPRGALSLSGAIVSLSDEAPHMLVVYSANGEMYKLRAADAKEKQFWVTQLRACAKYHMETNSKTTPSSRSRSLTLLPYGTPNSASPCSQRHLGTGAPSVVTITHHKSPAAARRAKSQYSGQLHEVREMMSQVEGQQKNLVHAIESLPGSGPLTSLDQDLLLLKATSAATLSCLGECLSLLQQSVHHAAQPSHRPGASENILGWHGPKSHSTEQLKNGTLSSLPSASASITWAILPNSAEDEQTFPSEPEPNSGPELVLSEDEKSDTEDQEETELGVMEDQRSVILHLISQLKLGMDLTKVVLPTFILEKRSLLEMYADFMAHPDLLLAVTAGATPQDRVICFVEYYLTAFHEGRKGALAKKPYNPIIGETFHCSWEVPKDRVKPKRTAPHTPAGHEHPMADDPSKNYKLRFVAEQVSHHPPISCFYCECKEKRLCVNTHVWTKSKFMGMSVGVSMIGEGVLRLLEHGEEYVFTLPSAYARSILTIPWVELGGKVSISCAKTGYSATVIFHTKPFYGGKVHRVTAEVKHNPTNTIVCKAHGEWNGTLEFTYNNGETKVIDTTALPVYPKKIRPLEKQGPMESRNLWREVTQCLRLGDIDAATEQKRRLEEKQRAEERKRENVRAPWRPKYFIQEVTPWCPGQGGLYPDTGFG